MVGSRPDSQQPHGALMTRLPYGRFCDELVAQTDLMRGVVAGADLSATVPTTPDWTLSQLLRHVGGNLRSLEQAVRTGTAVTEPERQVPDHGGPPGDDPAAIDAWLAEAAARCAQTLGGAGPDAEAQIWQIRWPTAAWARRAAHDLVVHRADAAGAVGAGYTVAGDLAADAVDEFLDLLGNPQVAASAPDPAAPTPSGPSTCTPPTPAPGWRPSGWSSSAPPASPGASPTRRPPWPCAPRWPTCSGS